MGKVFGGLILRGTGTKVPRSDVSPHHPTTKGQDNRSSLFLFWFWFWFWFLGDPLQSSIREAEAYLP